MPIIEGRFHTIGDEQSIRYYISGYCYHLLATVYDEDEKGYGFIYLDGKRREVQYNPITGLYSNEYLQED